jgi:hypothetical protein
LLKRKRTGLVCGFISVVKLAIISFSFLHVLLVRSLELHYSTLDKISQNQSDDSIHILVLGGEKSLLKFFTPQAREESHGL